MNDFDRYSLFKSDGKFKTVPFIKIRKKNSDIFIKYKKNKTRLDKLSYDYYNDPNYGWLIMQANPEYGSIENLIPNEVLLRIPFPLEETINDYINDCISYQELNS